MTPEGFKRKLTAILSADVVGYSRLMGEDEEATVRMLTAHREMMGTLIQKHQGRIVDSPGDNLLAEFASVLDAVRFAVEIQEELKARNADLPDDRKMEFRIGINLGDVIEEGERIYGDGINIAARVEGLAEPGGICISGTVYEHIKDKLALWQEYLGEHTVKNIKHPVRVYRVRMEPEAEAPQVSIEEPQRPKPWKWAILGAGAVLIVVIVAAAIWKLYLQPAAPPPSEVTTEKGPAFELPDKPSIAVLPFINMSDDPKQEYFSDGMTEEIIMGLSKVPDLFVIARNSTFVYKGRPVNIQQVSKELGVRYVLEGSVRKAADRVRITAQLIDAITGDHVWSERYDRDLKDIFALQDEITMKVITALQVTLTEGEQANILAKGTDNLEAYLKFLRGVKHLSRLNKQDVAVARKRAEETIALEPNYAMGYWLMARVNFAEVWLGSSKFPKESLARAIELARKALSLDDSLAEAHAILCGIYMLQRQYEKSLAEGEQAIALSPNSAEAHMYFGYSLNWAGEHEKALPIVEKAIRLDPFPRSFFFLVLGIVHRDSGHYEESMVACRKATNLEPNSIFARLCVTGAYSLLGREKEARTEASEVLRIDPKFSLEHFSKKLPYKNKADRERLINALRKAGLK